MVNNIEDEEALETSTVVFEFSNVIQAWIYDLFANWNWGKSKLGKKEEEICLGGERCG